MSTIHYGIAPPTSGAPIGTRGVSERRENEVPAHIATINQEYDRVRPGTG